MNPSSESLPSLDHVAIRRLVDSYAIHIDAPDPISFAALFTVQGQLISRNADGALWIREGTEQLLRGSTLFAEPRVFKRTMHQIGTHVADVDGDQGTGITYCLAHHLMEHDGRSQVH